MRSIGKTALLLGFASTILAGASAYAQDTIDISIAHIGPSSSPAIAGAIGPLKVALEKTGKVKVTMYGAGSPYSNPSKFSELVENGVVDMAFGVSEIEAGRYPLNTLFGEPFLVTDIEKATRANMRAVKTIPALAKEFSTMHLLQVSVVGPDQIHARSEINSIDSLKGKRILSTNPGQLAILREVGASPVVLPRSAAYENLQKGVVDGAVGTYQALAAFKLFEVTCCHFDWNVSVSENYLVMNKKKYASLPPDVKKVIDDYSTEEAAVSVAHVWTVATTEGKAKAKEMGHKSAEISQADIPAMRKRFQHLTDERLATLEKRGLPAKATYAKIIEMIKEAEAK